MYYETQTAPCAIAVVVAEHVARIRHDVEVCDVKTSALILQVYGLGVKDRSRALAAKAVGRHNAQAFQVTTTKAEEMLRRAISDIAYDVLIGEVEEEPEWDLFYD